MTQEELDAMMAGGLDDENSLSEEIVEENTIEETPVEEEINEEVLPEEESSESEEKDSAPKEAHEYRASADMSWPPPPPTDDHKMVLQLDDVTKDSELKAGEVFDKLEAINEFMMQAEENGEEAIVAIEKNIELFKVLKAKFPKVAEFGIALENNEGMKLAVESLVARAQDTEDEIMMTMDIMQYQDIHRQKIERVINVMRAVSKYMSHLFEGKIDDEKRVSSAVHIDGDENTDNVVSNDDIEALIAGLGVK